MQRMLRLCAALAVMLAVFSMSAKAAQLPAAVQEMMPADAVMEKIDVHGTMHMISFSIPETGEHLLLTYDERSGGVLFVETEKEADCDANAAPVERSFAEELVLQAYPGSHLLFSADTEAGKRMGVINDRFCGIIIAADGKIRSRSLQMGEMRTDGRLTMAGALQVLALHRPEAQFRALELDEDDGLYVYEGEAVLDGELYEFELDVKTGRLLEWERD